MLKQKGFTLIEMLVILAIIIILLIIALPGYESSRQVLALERSAVQFAQDLRWAEEMAMSARESSKCPGEYVYGVSLDQNDPERYFVFGDCNGNGTYQPADELIKEESLERSISFDIPENIDIVFIPPEPTVEITPDSETISINLKNEKDGSKTVKVNKIGLIEIE